MWTTIRALPEAQLTGGTELASVRRSEFTLRQAEWTEPHCEYVRSGSLLRLSAEGIPRLQARGGQIFPCPRLPLERVVATLRFVALSAVAFAEGWDAILRTLCGWRLMRCVQGGRRAMLVGRFRRLCASTRAVELQLTNGR